MGRGLISYLNFSIHFHIFCFRLPQCAGISLFLYSVYCRSQQNGVFIKLGHFLFLISFNNPSNKPSNVSINIVENFLKSHGFQETAASSKTSCHTNRADKLILNILVLSTQEKSYRTPILRYSFYQIELPLEITENSRETIF